MAGFHTKTFIEHNDYMSPKYAWENIIHYIPKDKEIWECFYGDGTSGTHMEELGLNVIHKEVDFFKNNLGDILISNPPYSIKKEVFTRLKELDKAFIMICPSSCINTQYMRNLFSDCENALQIIIPRKRIQFNKLVDGETPKEYKSCCNFDCFYYCYKMNLEKDIIWLKD
jgi:hypothetical protein